MTEDPPRQDRPRTWRWRLPVPAYRELPFLLVLAGVCLGLLIVGLHHFKRGSVLMGSALALGGVFRLVLSDRRAGLLVVRGRIFDAVTLIGLGVLVTVAAAIVPPP